MAMFNQLKKSFLSENEMYLGKKKVQIRKITPTKWKELFSMLDKLPGLVLQVFAAPKEDFYQTLIIALDVALDEVLDVVSTLSGVDKDYLADDQNEVGMDEIISYLSKMAKHNNLREMAKNVKSLLPER
jgi:ethanolamine utilization protein EutA (predicted chaperonin)